MDGLLYAGLFPPIHDRPVEPSIWLQDYIGTYLKPSLHFLRDKQGHEVDALVETGPNELHAIEVKSGETVASDFFAGLDYWRDNIPGRSMTPWLVHGGTERQDRSQGTVLPWNDLSPLLSKLVP